MEGQQAGKLGAAELVVLVAYGVGFWLGSGVNPLTVLVALISASYTGGQLGLGALLRFGLQLGVLLLTMLPAYAVGRRVGVYGAFTAAVGGFLFPISTIFSFFLLLVGGALAAVGSGFRESYERRGKLLS